MSPTDEMFAKDATAVCSDERDRILRKLGLRDLPITHGGIQCKDEETARIVRNAMQDSTILTAANEIEHEPAVKHPEWGHPEHWFVNHWLR